MYNLYLTKDILGSKEGRIKSTPYATCSTENQCKEIMLARLGGATMIPYLRATIINEKTKTYDYGSHTLFYEISEEESEQSFTSGYINVDFKNEIKTYVYCSECAKKDKEIKRLKRALKIAKKQLEELK